MSHSACTSLPIKTRQFTFAAIFGLAMLLIPSHAYSQTIIRNDFEDGTLQGWIPRGGTVVLTNSTEAAQAGVRSLKTTGRTAGFHGPSLNVLSSLVKGA